MDMELLTATSAIAALVAAVAAAMALWDSRKNAKATQLDIRFDEMRQHIVKVETRLDDHEKDCRRRDRDLTSNIGWIMGKLDTKYPDLPEPEEPTA